MRRSALVSTLLPVMLAVAAPAIFLLPACEAPRRDRDDDDDDDDRPPSLQPCTETADCVGGGVCVDELCRAPCSAADPCSGIRDVCDEERGVCVQCLGDADCGAGEACVVALGDCAPVEEQECTPNEIGCVDEANAFVCNADGTEQLTVPCRDDQICLGGACLTQVCEPSTNTCSGNALVTCDATGTDSAVTSCDGACSDTGAGCTCDAGACVARACEPGSSRCVGNSAQVCEGQGLGFGDLVDCGQDTCVAGRCVDETCTPGATFCSGATLLTCQGDGFGFDQTTCAEACGGADGSAACTDQVCTPLAQSCADASTLEICNAGGTDVLQIPCGLNQVCENGACVDEVCIPECGARECGPDPVCGTSCGTCGAGICNASGQCEEPAGPTMTVELSWTPSTQDMDVRLARDTNIELCGADVCSFNTCQSNDPRPDWDGTANISSGDPLLDVTDISNTNPEVIVLGLPTGSEQYRVGADNFGPRSNQTAATTTATIRVRLNGTLVSTHSRTVTSGTLWDGVVVTWNGTGLASSDDAGSVASFECSGEGGGGNSCTIDADCPDGQGCVSSGGLPFELFGSCADVQCTSNTDCSGGLQCNGLHNCVAGPLLNAGAQCDGDGDCRAGLHCDAITGRCEEACNPLVCSVNTPGCCPTTGFDECVADGLFGVTGNCG